MCQIRTKYVLIQLCLIVYYSFSSLINYCIALCFCNCSLLIPQQSFT